MLNKKINKKTFKKQLFSIHLFIPMNESQSFQVKSTQYKGYSIGHKKKLQQIIEKVW